MIDQILSVKWILNKCWDYIVDVLQISVDFKQMRSIARILLSEFEILAKPQSLFVANEI